MTGSVGAFRLSLTWRRNRKSKSGGMYPELFGEPFQIWRHATDPEGRKRAAGRARDMLAELLATNPTAFDAEVHIQPGDWHAEHRTFSAKGRSWCELAGTQTEPAATARDAAELAALYRQESTR